MRAPRLLEDRVYSEYVWGYVFLIPTTILFGVFAFLPVVRAVIFSFENFTGFTLAHEFAGLQNYDNALFHEPLFWPSIKVSAIYTLAVVPVQVIVPLFLAALIARLSAPALQTLFKSAFYLPQVTSGITLSLAWLWILYPMDGGLANWFVGLFHIPPVIWLGDTSTALPSIIVAASFSGWGSGIILYLAAMGGIPRSLYEAADIDCASGWSKFRNITVPLIQPTTLFLVVTSTIGSFQVFEYAYAMTQGGPVNSTLTYVYLIFNVAFEQLNFGEGAALAVLLGIVIIAVSVVQFKFLSASVEY